MAELTFINLRINLEIFDKICPQFFKSVTFKTMRKQMKSHVRDAKQIENKRRKLENDFMLCNIYV